MPAFEPGGLAPSGAPDRMQQAEALVRDWCGWHISPSKSDTYSPLDPGPYSLVLPSKNVTSVESVTVDGAALVDEVDYRWYPNGVIEPLSGWCWWRAPVLIYGTHWRPKVVVEFTHGYAEPPVAVQAAISDLANLLSSTNANLVSRRQVGQVQEQYAIGVGVEALPPATKTALLPYRIEPSL